MLNEERRYEFLRDYISYGDFSICNFIQFLRRDRPASGQDEQTDKNIFTPFSTENFENIRRIQSNYNNKNESFMPKLRPLSSGASTRQTFPPHRGSS